MLPTVVNIGFAPTFKGKRRKVEAHIIGFNKDIYRKRMRVFFIQRLRDEMGFRDKALLVGQIRKDITRALKVLGRDKPSKVRPWI
jgi:riboflavin kinase/FMN adenylyltransferase